MRDAKRTSTDANDETAFHEAVRVKETRKVRARKRREDSIWYGLGMMGMVGWSVAVPTLIGVAVGAWIDSRWPSSHSWTLMLLLGGLILGCVNAYAWVVREREYINESRGKPNGDSSKKPPTKRDQ